MNFYVAGKWEDKARVKEIQNALREAGHTITVDWTNHEYPTSEKELEAWAVADIDGAISAGGIVVLMEDNHNYKGAWVELGATIAAGGVAYIIGHAGDSCIFLHHPQVAQLDTVNDFYKLFKLKEATK